MVGEMGVMVGEMEIMVGEVGIMVGEVRVIVVGEVRVMVVEMGIQVGMVVDGVIVVGIMKRIKMLIIAILRIKGMGGVVRAVNGYKGKCNQKIKLIKIIGGSLKTN